MRPCSRRASLALSMLAAVPLVACTNGDAPGDAGTGLDSGPAVDAGPAPDSGAPDAGLPDLTVDGDRAVASARVIWEYFAEDDCVIVEGCVVTPGWRRLLRFETFTPNHGTADFAMGPPGDHPDLFEYSECHMHYHYNGYADYRLLDGTTEVGMGHKQAFCLMDSERMDSDSTVRARPYYDCDNQGISRGWGDSYYPALDCQWIDVTDVAPGDYTLRITINGDRTVPELSYDDNVVAVTVNVPDDALLDPTAACATALDGPRDCGWTTGASFSCTAGEHLEIGCGAGCSLGTCGRDDDALLRVCPGDAPCTSRQALAYGDDGCGDSYCPLTDFVCPAEGRYTVLTAPYLVGDTVACVPAARVITP